MHSNPQKVSKISTYDVSVYDGPEPVYVHVLEQLLQVLDAACRLQLGVLHARPLQLSTHLALEVGTDLGSLQQSNLQDVSAVKLSI